MSIGMLIVAIVFAVVFVWCVARREVRDTRHYCEYLASEWRARAENETTQTRQYYCYWTADMIERAATIDDAVRIDAEGEKGVETMRDKELKAEKADFKEWYINGGHLKAGKWSFAVFELSSGLRFAVMSPSKLQEIWRKEGKGYERVI